MVNVGHCLSRCVLLVDINVTLHVMSATCVHGQRFKSRGSYLLHRVFVQGSFKDNIFGYNNGDLVGRRESLSLGQRVQEIKAPYRMKLTVA